MKNFIRQWKKNKAEVCIIMIGYIIGILAVSLGISITNNAKEYSLECTRGKPDNSCYVDIKTLNQNGFNKNDILSALEKTSKKARVEIVDLGGDVYDGNKLLEKVDIIPVAYFQEPQWKMNILKGRDFNAVETQSKGKIAVVGKEIGKAFLKDGVNEANIYLYGEKYKVIGVVGREHRETRWDYSVVIPLKNVYDMKNFDNSQFSLFISDNKGNPKKVARDIAVDIKKLDSKVIFKEKNNMSNTNDIVISVLLTIIVSGAILFITAVNIMNLSTFRVLTRQKEIAIKKALGATDRVIVKMIVDETMIQVIFAAIIAFILQWFIQPKIQGIVIEAELSLNWINFVLGFGIAIVTGILASLVPVRAALKISPAVTIKVE